MDIASSNLGIYLVIAMMAMAISMAIVPLMIRLAPALGMMDKPDQRKVHDTPIPRVGGIGIVIGAIIPMIIWLPFTDLTLSILFGALILLIFGTWDDIAELGHYVKFVGQFLAAAVVVYYGDLYVSYFPLNSYETISEAVGRPFTVIAIVGMINAINHSDGLDGLAGGESLISLSVIAYLAFAFNNDLMLILIASTIGGIFGFLRFNSHPARVFMGDGGSQFLGFMLAVLVIYLTQNANTTLSPSITVLLLGLPIVDILAVFFLRAKHKLNLFKATKNHIHHRLLDIGFLHYESVMFIYSIQFILVISAIPLMYENDLLVLIYYLIICASVFVFLTVFERKNIRVHAGNGDKKDLFALFLRKYPIVADVPLKSMGAGLSLFVIAASLVTSEVPVDFAVSSLILLVAVIASGWLGTYLYRLVMFIMIGFSVYLLSTYPPAWLLEQISLVYLFFITMTVLLFLTARITVKDRFQITPLDYLVVIMAIIVSLAPGIEHGASSMVWMIVQMIILFYVCELVIQNMKSRLNSYTGAAVLALALIAFRGLV